MHACAGYACSRVEIDFVFLRSYLDAVTSESESDDRLCKMSSQIDNNDRWSSDSSLFPFTSCHHYDSSTSSPLQGRSKLFQGGVAEVYIVSRGGWGHAP